MYMDVGRGLPAQIFEIGFHEFFCLIMDIIDIDHLLVILIWVVTGREDLAPTFLVYKNNPMNVIWHNDKCAQIYVRKMDKQFIPPFLNNFAIST